MGEGQTADFRLAFDRRIVLQFHGAEVAVPKQLFTQILHRIWVLAPGGG